VDFRWSSRPIRILLTTYRSELCNQLPRRLILALDSSENRYMPDSIQLNTLIDTFNQLLGWAKIREDELMLGIINQYILGFNIPMCDWKHGEIVKSSKDLICVEFSYYWWEFSSLDYLVKIVWEIIHYYI